MKALSSGQAVYNDAGKAYEVGEEVGKGGFGLAYSAYEMSRNGKRRVRKVCLKVCENGNDWHGEAFFGKVLHDDDRAVRLRDAFVSSTGHGRHQARRHVLIFEFMGEGTVGDAVEAKSGSSPWKESRVRKEIGSVLELLAKMHNVGITHRDLTPANVFLRNGRLVLGDFGISRITLDPKDAEATAFTPAFAPKAVWMRNRWGPADPGHQRRSVGATSFRLRLNATHRAASDGAVKIEVVGHLCFRHLELVD